MIDSEGEGNGASVNKRIKDKIKISTARKIQCVRSSTKGDSVERNRQALMLIRLDRAHGYHTKRETQQKVVQLIKIWSYVQSVCRFI